MEASTLLQFIKRCKKFTHDNGITSSLKVDAKNRVEDLHDHFGTEVGGIIADVDNGIGEVIRLAIAFYEKTGNKKMVEKFKSLK
jgi:hypothetical protein